MQRQATLLRGVDLDTTIDFAGDDSSATTASRKVWSKPTVGALTVFSWLLQAVAARWFTPPEPGAAAAPSPVGD